jgi:tetratricopeptide (TPR) repeat protein
MRFNFLLIAMALLLVQSSPGSAQNSQTNSGEAALKSKKAAEEERFYSVVVATNASDADAWSKLGHARRVQGRYQEALNNYQTALKLSPSKSEFHNSMGLCYYGLKKYQEAADQFLQYAKFAPTNASAHYWAGLCLEQLPQIERAIGEFKAALLLDPNSDDSYEQLAWCLITEGRSSEARDLLIRRLSSHRGNAQENLLLAFAFANLGRRDDAAVYFQKALVIEPENLQAWVGLGDAQLFSGRPALGEAALKEACRVAPQNFEARFKHGMILSILLRFDEAVQELEKAQKLSPKNDDVREVLFMNYLCLMQFHKAREIYPAPFDIGATALMVLFSAALVVLLTKSFKIGVASAPGLGFAAGWLLFYSASQVMGGLLVGLVQSSPRPGDYSMGLIVGSVPVLVALGFAFRRQPWGAPFVVPQSLSWRQAGSAVAGLCLVLLLNWLYEKAFTVLAGHPPEQGWTLQMLGNMVRSNPASTVASVALIIPIVEETLFRGLLFGALEKRLGLWTILVTAVFFGAIHMSLSAFIPLIVIGLLLGWVRWKSGSIWLSAILHIINNGLALALYWHKFQASS